MPAHPKYTSSVGHPAATDSQRECKTPMGKYKWGQGTVDRILRNEKYKYAYNIEKTEYLMEINIEITEYLTIINLEQTEYLAYNNHEEMELIYK